MRALATLLLGVALLSVGCAGWSSLGMTRVAVARDGRSFSLAGFTAPFRPLGFNYDHDEEGRLLEDYWVDDWSRVVADFEAMRAFGANVVRVHLQLARFMQGPSEPDGVALQRLEALLRLAERLELRLDLTGLGAYRRSDVPAWYDALDEDARWETQAAFWRAIGEVGARSPAVFCYDLMNEPVAPAERVDNGDWLPGEPVAGMQYVQFVTLDPAGRTPESVALAWTRRMAAAVRSTDSHALITVGLLPWSLDRPGLRSGFVPQEIAPILDFVSVHLYPESEHLDEALETLRGFLVGKPLVVEEIFPLYATVQELEGLRAEAGHEVSGWLGFFRPFPWPVAHPPKEGVAGAAPREGIVWIAGGAVRDLNTIGSSRVRTR